MISSGTEMYITLFVYRLDERLPVFTQFLITQFYSKADVTVKGHRGAEGPSPTLACS